MGTFYHFFCPYNVRCPGFATSLPSVYRGRRLKCHSFPCPFYGVQFIMQRDNEYYLTHDAKRRKSVTGALFMEDV